MSAPRSRVGGVERALTPQQRVRRWLRTVHAFPSFDAYAASLRERSLYEWPLGVLARPAMAGAATRLLAWTQARDVGFMVHLVFEVQLALAQALEARRPWVGWLLEGRVRLSEDLERAVRADASWANVAIGLPDPTHPAVHEALEALRRLAGGGPLAADPDAGRAECWRGQAKGLLVDLLALQHAIRALEERYFSGEAVAFAGDVAGLEELVSPLTEAIKLFNDTVAVGAEREGLQLDLTNLRERAAAVGAARAQIMADTAGSRALAYVGKLDDALDLLTRHLPSPSMRAAPAENQT